jgi:hypothetical protein
MTHHYTHREIRISEKLEGRITRGLRQTQPESVKVYRLLPTTTQSSKWPPKLQETPHYNKKATLQHCHKIQHTSLPPDDLRKTFLVASTSPRPHPYPSPRPRTKESGCQEKELQPGSKTEFCYCGDSSDASRNLSRDQMRRNTTNVRTIKRTSVRRNHNR